MKAIVLREFGGPEKLRLEEVHKPTVAGKEVLVRVMACGVCYRDLLDCIGAYPWTKLPIILGHEVAGEVAKVGEQVVSFSPGDRVVSLVKMSCGTCKYCRTSHENLCRQGPGHLAREMDGGDAEYIKVWENAVCKLPEGIPFEEGSIIACAIGTNLHALRNKARVAIGDTVLITGAGGGLGLHAIQVAKLCGAKVIAVTSSQEKINKIVEVGADEVIFSRDSDFSKEVKALTGGEGADVALEIVGSATFEATLRSLAPLGRLVFVGNVEASPVQVRPAVAIQKELEFYGITTLTLEELKDTVSLVDRGLIKPIVSQVLPLEEAATAHRLLADRQPAGRVVLRV